MNALDIVHTDQKIRYARVHLMNLTRAIEDSQGVENHTLISAYEQALSFHLILLCDAFKKEIAKDYNIPLVKEDSFQVLSACLDEKDIICLQCALLAELEADSASWLAGLLYNYQAQWENAKRISRPLSDDNLPSDAFAGLRINAIELKEVTYEPLVQQYQNSFNQLQDIIEQYRSLMQEW